MLTQASYKLHHVHQFHSSVLVTGCFTAAGQQLLPSRSIHIHHCEWTLMRPQFALRPPHSGGLTLEEATTPHHRTMLRTPPPPSGAYISLESKKETARTATDFQRFCAFVHTHTDLLNITSFTNETNDLF